MAFWNKAKVTQYKTNPKTGKKYAVSESVVRGKGANVDKALMAGSQASKPTRLSNQRQQIVNQHRENMAKIAGTSTNIANAITQAGLTAQKAIGGTKAVETNTVNTSTVDQLVNGGAQVASTMRDDVRDEDDDSEWVA